MQPYLRCDDPWRSCRKPSSRSATLTTRCAASGTVAWDLNHRLQDGPTEGVIPLPPVTTEVMNRIVSYCEYHHDHQSQSDAEKKAWDDAFIALEDEALFAIILAANYLEIPALMNLGCQRVANYIRACKTPQDIRRRFNILNDFTPEEEAQVASENIW